MTSEDSAEFEHIETKVLKENKQQTEQQNRCFKHRTERPVDEENALPKTTVDTSEKFQNDFFFSIQRIETKDRDNSNNNYI
mmetsp:Transcript_3740/g.5592  ORF Transcript_3740/g.5592 Transcript_3740/m.5592 type:complete len:81 (+) Transcript_3740:219-461(+)